MHSQRVAVFCGGNGFIFDESNRLAIDDKNTKELVIQVLDVAITNRKMGSGLIWHSDRGPQYVGYEY